MVGEGRLPPSSPFVSSVAIHLFVLCISALSPQRPCSFGYPNFLVVGWKVVSISSNCGHRSWMVNYVFLTDTALCFNPESDRPPLGNKFWFPSGRQTFIDTGTTVFWNQTGTLPAN